VDVDSKAALLRDEGNFLAVKFKAASVLVGTLTTTSHDAFLVLWKSGFYFMFNFIFGKHHES